MRLWERSLRRASIPIAYSEGFNPRPRLSFSSPLAVGTTSEAELMDIYLEQRISPHHLTTNLSGQLPNGIAISEVQEVGLKVPSLQSQTSHAEYAVTVETDKSQQEVKLAIQDFLNREHMQWQHIRDTKIREYDIRGLVGDIKIVDHQDNKCSFSIRLKISGRPEQVVLALGFTNHPKSIHRTDIIVDTATGSS